MGRGVSLLWGLRLHPMSGWLLVAPVTLLAPSNPCVAPAAGGDEDNHKEQPESPGERRPGGKNT